MVKDNKSDFIKIRVSSEERDLINKKAEMANMNVSTYMRQRAMSDKAILYGRHLPNLIAHLGKTASLLNGIAHENIINKKEFNELKEEAIEIYACIQADYKEAL